MVPARAPPKTTSNGTGKRKGKGKGKGKSTQSKMWIDGRKNEEILTNESDDREDDNTRDNEKGETVNKSIPGILDTGAMKRIFKVVDRLRNELEKENSEEDEKQKKHIKKKHKLGDKDVEMSEKRKRRRKKET